MVKGGLRESGQEWALVACLTDNLNIIVAAMMGWSFPFSPEMGRVTTHGEQWKEAIMRMQNQELIEKQVLESAYDFIHAQGVAQDRVIIDRFTRKLKSMQAVMVRGVLDLIDNDMKVPKLGMLTTRHYVERAAQSTACKSETSITLHVVFLEIWSAPSSMKDAARLRREAMAQVLKRPCREPHVMLECLQQFEDKKRAYIAEFAAQLPEDFENDLLRQQQENAKFSDNADMRALLRKIYEVSNRGGEPLHISALIKEVQEFVASTARSDHAGNAKGQAAVPQDLIAAVWTGKEGYYDKKSLVCPRLQEHGVCKYAEKCFYKHPRILRALPEGELYLERVPVHPPSTSVKRGSGSGRTRKGETTLSTVCFDCGVPLWRKMQILSRR